MNLTTAYFTIPREAQDDKMWRWYNAPGKRSVSLRPDNHGTTRATLTFWNSRHGNQEGAPAQQKACLHALFADAGWQTDRVLAGMDHAEDFYFDVLRQVRMPRWSKGRVVLIGDAAWCVTPLGGISATLAITTSYVLAEELRRHCETVTARAEYEAQMRPMMEERQHLPRMAPRLMHPHTRLGVHLLHAILSFASLPPVRSLASKLAGPPSREPDRSRYC